MDGKNGRKAIVYNTEEEKRNGGEGKRKRKNGKNYVLSSHNTRACPRILFALI